MNIAPSFLKLFLITWSVELEPGPEAFIMRDFSTSAGEQTVVATVPYSDISESFVASEERRGRTAAKLAVK
jgi:hypothetical protein